jgi:hypothetical protein
MNKTRRRAALIAFPAAALGKAQAAPTKVNQLPLETRLVNAARVLLDDVRTTYAASRTGGNPKVRKAAELLREALADQGVR